MRLSNRPWHPDATPLDIEEYAPTFHPDGQGVGLFFRGFVSVAWQTLPEIGLEDRGKPVQSEPHRRTSRQGLG